MGLYTRRQAFVRLLSMATLEAGAFHSFRSAEGRVVVHGRDATLEVAMHGNDLYARMQATSMCGMGAKRRAEEAG